jgi:hypothetical protein
MLDERLQAIDCQADCALRAAYEVCNRIDTDGIFYVGQLMTRWSLKKGTRRRLRKALDDLVEVRLVRRLEHAEVLSAYQTSVDLGHEFGLRPVANRHYFLIVDYLETQPSAEEKCARREQNRARQQRFREQQSARAVTLLRNAPPDPDPGPNTNINKEAETIRTQSGDPLPPSPPASRATETPTGSKLQREYGERWQALYGRPFRWTATHLDALAEIEAKAAETPELVQPALDAFFADEEQRHFKHIPAGLLMHWKRYVAGPKQRLGAQQQQLRNAERDLRYYQELAEAGDRPAPMSLAELEPRYLEDMLGKYPGLDLSQVRSRPRAVPAKTEPKPEQRSNGTPGNVSDDPELAKYLI